MVDDHVHALPWAVTRQLGYNLQKEFHVVAWSQPRGPVPAASKPLEINQRTSEPVIF